MRRQINGQNVGTLNSTSGPPSDLYRRFKKQFSILLNPDPTNRNFLDTVYVENTAYHSEVKEFSAYEEDGYKCIIGLTGIGKTTLLRNVLDLSSEVAVRGDALIVLINPESTATASDPQSHAAVIFGAAESLLRRKFSLSINSGELLRFIQNNKPTLIEGARLNRDDDGDRLLNQLYTLNRRGYELEALKHLLLKEECPINRVLLVLDNIEAISDWKMKSGYVRELLTDYECLKNSDPHYYAKLIVSCRPDTYRRLIRDDTFNTYPYRNELAIEIPPSLDDLFRTRFKAIVDKLGIAVEDRPEWDRAHRVLDELAKQLSLHNHNLLMSLANYNVREGLRLFELLLANRQWFQKGWPLQAAFKIQRSYFDPNPATIKKALIYGNGRFYTDSPSNPFRNLLRNDQDADHDLIPLYIIAFVMSQSAREEDDNHFQYIDAETLFDSVDDMFQMKEAQEHFRRFVKGLLERGVLLQSPWSVGTSDIQITVAPRGFAILHELSSSSFCLGAYRDDLWTCSKITSFKHFLDLHDSQQFTEIYSLVQYYVRCECDCLQLVRETQQLSAYTKLFGKKPVTKPLYDGIRSSYHAHYEALADEKGAKMSELKKEFGMLRRLLGDSSE